ncbi:MAG: histidine kinase [Actinomycetota bacterium]|nr:histidine kinase [Actinomycetota bacterium]
MWVVTAIFVVADLVLTFVARHDLRDSDLVFSLLGGLSALVYASIGSLIARRGSNVIGWILIGAGLAGAVVAVGGVYPEVGLISHPGSLPAPRMVAALTNTMWIPSLAPVAFMLMVFPTGTLPSPRWRPFLGLGIAGAVVGFVVLAVNPKPLSPEVGLSFPNPIGIESLSNVISTILTAAAWISVVGLVASLLALIIRFRRGDRELRQQIKWLAFAAGTEGLLLLAVVTQLVSCNCDNPPLGNFTFFLFFLVFALGIPGAIGAAVLKYRLYDIDVIISKTVLYSALAAFLTGVYVAIVVGVGTAVGQRGNSSLTIVAAVVIAVVFQPVRQRAQRLANRIVYGKRATPYEVLSEFSDRMASAYASEDVLPRMAQILATGTGAVAAHVWLRSGNEIREAASWPTDGTLPPVAIRDDRPGVFPNGEHGVEVRHQGELLGALSVAALPSDPMNPSKEKLVRDLAAQAGLVLRNVRLIEELRASRRRIVTAQDERAKALERNLHDGAQQQLVALGVQLGLARNLASKEAPGVAELLDGLRAQAIDALDNLRDLARGIYPPLLADQGLAAALDSQARKAAVPTAVDAPGIGRYPPEVEAAVYFCSLEALQNVAKYAHASQASIKLTQINGSLTFEVTDDGDGFDQASIGYGTGLQGMADRLDALGGTLEIRSAPGEGTAVTGRVPST